MHNIKPNVIIQEISFDANHEFLKDYIVNENPITALAPLSKINFLVGANNSGKSRFMRYLMLALNRYKRQSDRQSWASDSNGKNPKIALLNITYKDFKLRIDEIIHGINNDNVTGFFNDLFKPELDRKSLSEEDVLSIYFKMKDLFKKISADSKDKDNLQRLDKAEEEVDQYIKSKVPFHGHTSINQTYLPTLRSLRRFLRPEETNEVNLDGPFTFDNFIKIGSPILGIRSMMDHFVREKPKDYWDKDSGLGKFESSFLMKDIFSGEALYDQIYELRNSTEDTRLLLTGFEDFLSTHFFNNQRIQLHAIKKDNVEDIFVKIGNEKEFPIYQLGDGIQSIILLTFPLFYNRNSDNHVIYYEEPELYLHPGMQRIFVDVLRSFNNIQAFVVTHSNHILDTSLDYKEDISIFSFEKMQSNNHPRFNIEMLSSPGLSLLNLLGVRNSSIFLSNCTVWVEGISDRLYIKKYLDLYIQHEKDSFRQVKYYYEDLHYSFLEFGGNQIVHYDFTNDASTSDREKINATRITNRMLLIHDQDTKKESRHTLLRKQLGENYIQLPTLEIENLISIDVLQLTLNSYKISDDTELIFNTIEPESYVLTPISEAISKIIKSGNIKKIFDVKTETTIPRIRNKADFALTATSHMKSWDDLSEAAKDMTIQIYKFIERHNFA